MQTELTVKQTKFVTEYIKTGNGTQSAIKAGYSRHSAREIAKENITKPLIKEKIEKAMSKEAEKLGLNAEWVLKNLMHHAANLDNPNPSIKANELIGKNLKMWHENEVDLTVKHKSVIAALEELE